MGGMKILIVLWMFVFLMFMACASHKLPKEKLFGFTSDKIIEYRGDSLFIYINHYIPCPMRYSIHTENKETNAILKPYMPITMNGLRDTTLHIPIPKELQAEFDATALYGDPSLPIKNPDMTFPFPSGNRYKIIQGNNSNPSHNHVGSRFALDFSLQVNDTITAAAAGHVVAMVEGYEHGGGHKKWKPYSNYIMTYDSTTNLFFLYGHLVKAGSFVELGDFVTKGEPIGLSGLTGYTTIEHLHFDVKKAVEGAPGIVSTPHTYSNGTKSTELKRGMRVSRK